MVTCSEKLLIFTTSWPSLFFRSPPPGSGSASPNVPIWQPPPPHTPFTHFARTRTYEICLLYCIHMSSASMDSQYRLLTRNSWPEQLASEQKLWPETSCLKSDLHGRPPSHTQPLQQSQNRIQFPVKRLQYITPRW